LAFCWRQPLVLLLLLLLEFLPFLILLRECFSRCCWYFWSSFGVLYLEHWVVQQAEGR